jgi:CBS domain-containing protein
MVDWPGGKVIIVEQLLPKARERLVRVTDDARLIEAAKLLQAAVELVIVCDTAGVLAGVITKTEIVVQISRCQGSNCIMSAELVMTRDVVLCEPKDLLRDVWARMKVRDLKHIPVVDEESRPLGLLHARDILQALLSASENEDALLRDYVMGVGYR